MMSSVTPGVGVPGADPDKGLGTAGTDGGRLGSPGTGDGEGLLGRDTGEGEGAGFEVACGEGRVTLAPPRTLFLITAILAAISALFCAMRAAPESA